MKQAWRGAEARKRTWRDRLHDEELNGFAFAFKARSIAMAVILVWVIASASAARLPALLWMGAMFFAIGWIAYRTRAHPRMLLIQSACAAADVALLLLANHVPQGDVYEWALQIWARRSAFLYLVAYVACSALTFSVVVVLAAGTAAVIGQIASFMFVVYAAEKVDSFKGLAARDPYHLLQQMIALQDIEPWIFMVNQIVLLAVTTGLIASAIWRARQHVERAVQAETQSSNLERYFSPAVAKRLAENVAALDQGRVQDAAVVFVDIVGSIHITEAFPPEEVIAAVRALHRRLVPIVFRRSGIIDKFLGDGMMAVFGAPEPSA